MKNKIQHILVAILFGCLFGIRIPAMQPEESVTQLKVLLQSTDVTQLTSKDIKQAQSVIDSLRETEPENADAYQAQLNDLKEQWQASKAEKITQLSPREQRILQESPRGQRSFQEKENNGFLSAQKRIQELEAQLAETQKEKQEMEADVDKLEEKLDKIEEQGNRAFKRLREFVGPRISQAKTPDEVKQATFNGFIEKKDVITQQLQRLESVTNYLGTQDAIPADFAMVTMPQVVGVLIGVPNLINQLKQNLDYVAIGYGTDEESTLNNTLQLDQLENQFNDAVDAYMNTLVQTVSTFIQNKKIRDRLVQWPPNFEDLKLLENNFNEIERHLLLLSQSIPRTLTYIHTPSNEFINKNNLLINYLFKTLDAITAFIETEATVGKGAYNPEALEALFSRSSLHQRLHTILVNYVITFEPLIDYKKLGITNINSTQDLINALATQRAAIDEKLLAITMAGFERIEEQQQTEAEQEHERLIQQIREAQQETEQEMKKLEQQLSGKR